MERRTRRARRRADVVVHTVQSSGAAIFTALLIAGSEDLSQTMIVAAMLLATLIASHRLVPRWWSLRQLSPAVPTPPTNTVCADVEQLVDTLPTLTKNTFDPPLFTDDLDATPLGGLGMPHLGGQLDELERVATGNGAASTKQDTTPDWKILLSPPEVGECERELLMAAFDSNWIAPAGPDLDAFEAELAELTGATAVAALSSGTAALHLALLAVGVKPGDDVLVSTLTFAASAFAVTYVGARPCFVDCDAATWHLDPDLLETELARRQRTGRRAAAVVAVDLYGSVSDGARIAAICAAYGVPFIQDAAQAVGAFRDGVHAGRHGDVGILSFNGNKMVTAGGGGALISDDKAIVTHARHLSTQARQPVPWYDHHDIGFNYRMGNLNAAVGRGQLRTLPTRIEGRRRVRAAYEEHLGWLPGDGFHYIPDACSPNYWLTTVTIDAAVFGATTKSVLAALRNAGIEGRNVFKPMHLQPVFADNPSVGGDVATSVFESGLSLPSGSRMTDDEVRWICDVFASTGR